MNRWYWSMRFRWYLWRHRNSPYLWEDDDLELLQEWTERQGL